MQEVTLKLTVETLNILIQALNDSVAYRQQSTAILMSSLQSQANSQIQQVLPPAPPVVYCRGYFQHLTVQNSALLY